MRRSQMVNDFHARSAPTCCTHDAIYETTAHHTVRSELVSVCVKISRHALRSLPTLIFRAARRIGKNKKIPKNTKNHRQSAKEVGENSAKKRDAFSPTYIEQPQKLLDVCHEYNRRVTKACRAFKFESRVNQALNY